MGKLRQNNGINFSPAVWQTQIKHMPHLCSGQLCTLP